MISADANTTWTAIATQLRPFIRHRVNTDADADDVMQDVLLRVHGGIANLEDEQRFIGWIYRIAVNAITDHVRKKMRHPAVALDHEPAAEPEEPDDDLNKRLAQTVSMFVAALPAPYREAVTLVELNGLSHREAADMVGVSVSGMKSRVQRGRQRLRAMFEACCEIALDSRNQVIACQPRPDGMLPDCEC